MRKKAFLHCFLFLLFFFLFVSSPSIVSASEEPSVNVKLQNFLGNKNSISVRLVGDFKDNIPVIDLKPNVTYQFKTDGTFIKIYEQQKEIYAINQPIQIAPIVPNEQNRIFINNRPYAGNMTFQIESGSYIRPYNEVPIEIYLKGVVSHEMSNYWGSNGGLEALKAQAVSARTFAMLNRDKVMTDTQSHQVYGGLENYTYINRAVEETEGVVLKYNGNYVSTFYSSSNGGKILSNTNSWGTSLVPYLRTKDDPYDIRSGNANVNWTISLHRTQINLNGKDLTNPSAWWNTVTERDGNLMRNVKSWLQSNNRYINSRYEVKIIDIPDVWFKTTFTDNERIDGRVTFRYVLRDKNTNGFVMEGNQLKIHTLTVDRRAYDIRSMFGSTYMKSPYIKNVENDGTYYTIHGGGWGHGIGMSQYGAYQMSKEGKTYQDILSFYYPGTELVSTNPFKLTNISHSFDQNQNLIVQIEASKTSTGNVTIWNKSYPTDRYTTPTRTFENGKRTFVFDTKDLHGLYKISINLTDAKGNHLDYTYPGQIKIENSSIEKVSLALYNPHNVKLYHQPNMRTDTGWSVAPQRLHVVAKTNNHWYQIQTSIGYKWIQLKQPLIGEAKSINKTITLKERTNIYQHPIPNTTRLATLAPQKVKVIEEWEDKTNQTTWYKVESWVGPVWIQEPKLDMTVFNGTFPTIRNAYLYKKPDTNTRTSYHIAPQTVHIKGKYENWYQISSSIGLVWIKEEEFLSPITKTSGTKLVNEQRTLYYLPSDTTASNLRIAPQTVHLIGKWTDVKTNQTWLKISTWVGPMWIKE